jgi:hypothetical protein
VQHPRIHHATQRRGHRKAATQLQFERQLLQLSRTCFMGGRGSRKLSLRPILPRPYYYMPFGRPTPGWPNGLSGMGHPQSIPRWPKKDIIPNDPQNLKKGFFNIADHLLIFFLDSFFKTLLIDHPTHFVRQAMYQKNIFGELGIISNYACFLTSVVFSISSFSPHEKRSCQRPVVEEQFSVG